MKLVELGLARFGPFTDATLSFGTAPGGLHIVYGKNEAGKSTALRAITALLFGIPEATEDAHLHPMPELRIRGRLAGPDGSELVLQRRKGRKNTLLDESGEPIDEVVLSRLLGGLSRELFETTYGLDGQRLRQGGEALLRGKGDVGQTLFDAAVGGQGVRDVIAQLAKEAEELYSPKAHATRPSINARLRAFREAEQLARRESTQPRVWLEQKRELDRALAELTELEQRRRGLLLERERLERASRALPKLGRRAALLGELAPLSDVPRLAPDAAEKRSAAQSRLESARRGAEREANLLAELAAEREGHEVPELLLSLEEAEVEHLAVRLAEQKKADLDRVKREAELSHAESEALVVLGELGRRRLEEARDFELTVAERARLARLGRDRAELDTALETARARLAELVTEEAKVARQRAALAPTEEVAELARAVEAAQKLGDVDVRLAALRERAAALSTEVSRGLAALGWSLPSDRLFAAALPSSETVERFEADLRAIEAEEQRLAERIEDSRKALVRVIHDLEVLCAAGEVPSEADLAQARARRDEAFAELRKTLGDGGSDTDAVSALGQCQELEARQRDADELADRLRHEAERVTHSARLGADQRALEREREGQERALAELQARRSAWQAAWRAAWPGDVSPLSPAEMRGFLARWSALAEREKELSAVAREASELALTRLRHVGELASALGLSAPEGDALLEPLLRAAQSTHARRSEVVAAHARLDADAQRVAEQLVQAQSRLEDRNAAVETWRLELGAAVSRLGLGAEVSAEEVDAVVTRADELARKLESARGLRHRIEAIERDAQALRSTVSDWVARFAPDLAEEPYHAAGSALVVRHRQARTALARQRDVDRRIERAKERQSELGAEIQRAEAELAVLMEEARVDSADRLPAREHAARKLSELERELASIERDLGEIGGGMTLDELAEDARGLELDDTRVRLHDIDHELELVETERDSFRQQIASIRAGLERLDASHRAAEATKEAMAHAARIREDVERYLRVKVAQRVLTRQVERYREKNQGPLLERVNEVFPRLTEGRYPNVRVDVGKRDEPVLRCSRADGQLVDVEGLSEGTRDQLYLALRLASLARQAELGLALPLVLDDVLVHFDEARSGAALEVLGEMAAGLQVLLFTHHAHVVELARARVRADRLVVHELVPRSFGPSPSTGPTRASV